VLKKIIFGFLLVGSAGAEVVATFRQGDISDVRLDRLPALAVPVGEAATPFLSPGKFEVEWKGKIELKKRSRLYFSSEGNGKVVLNIAGEVVHQEEGEFGKTKSERLRLNPGEHEILIQYTSAEDGSGNFRLYWESEDMVRQTIAPNVYRATVDDAVTASESKRRGRMVFAEQNCAKCHAPEAGFGAKPMPEMGEIAPILSGIGDRVSEEWLRLWLADPKALKPGTHMPMVVDPSTPEGLQKAADMAAYLMESKLGAEKKAAPDQKLAKAGGVHFHELGCVACHDLSGKPADPNDKRRVPLNNIASKFQGGQLEAFLKKPEAFHPFTAMPNFQLKDDEAAALAAFLHHDAIGKETKLQYIFPKGDASRGAAVAESLQCGTCHPGLPGGVSKALSLEGIFKLDWTEKGCISGKDKRPHLPVPNLSDADKAALLAFSKSSPDTLKKDSSSEFAKRQIEAKHCVACHSLDDQVSLLSSLHGNTEALAAHVEELKHRVDQSRPALTFMGEMLYTDYLESILAGKVKDRPRPWLGTRMPAFKGHAKPLAEGMSRQHGFTPGGPPEVKVDQELAKIGHDLIGAKGFGCTTCHGVGSMQATDAFEVGAINFDQISKRLREGYYYRWMDHPAEVTPGSKMPRYAEGNVSQRADILEGDVKKQYEAIWNWIHSLNRE
jgi:mono/diheme cytochrome c family protein